MTRRNRNFLALVAVGIIAFFVIEKTEGSKMSPSAAAAHLSSTFAKGKNPPVCKGETDAEKLALSMGLACYEAGYGARFEDGISNFNLSNSEHKSVKFLRTASSDKAETFLRQVEAELINIGISPGDANHMKERLRVVAFG